MAHRFDVMGRSGVGWPVGLEPTLSEPQSDVLAVWTTATSSLFRVHQRHHGRDAVRVDGQQHFQITAQDAHLHFVTRDGGEQAPDGGAQGGGRVRHDRPTSTSSTNPASRRRQRAVTGSPSKSTHRSR